MKLPSKIRFLDEKTKQAYEKADKKLKKWLDSTFEKIEKDAFCGIQIQKKLIPKEYAVNNLWKYDLPCGWRLLYSVENQEIVIVAIIIEWLNHKEYEKRFKF
jgi:Txe/YoeB family toxin of Txe-Axe toxin-antitoxin module